MVKSLGRRRGLERRRARLEPRARVLVVCEGEVTEPRYLNELRRRYRNGLLQIEIVEGKGVPKSVVEHAVMRKREADRQARALRDENQRLNEIWCVIDVDEHPKLADAKQQAQAHNIHLAISNPCFELWLLLHFTDHRSPQERAVIHAECRRYMHDYEKDPPMDVLLPLYESAVKRAHGLDKWQCGRGCKGENPHTTVHLLTERIKELTMSPW